MGKRGTANRDLSSSSQDPQPFRMGDGSVPQPRSCVQHASGGCSASGFVVKQVNLNKPSCIAQVSSQG